MDFLSKDDGKMGFHHRWISLMMNAFVSYSILANRGPKGFIKPTRGLRKGDPLSPYLFLIYVEGLHSLISQARLDGGI